MKLAIVGSRTFNDYETLSYALKSHFSSMRVDEIISGGASGADKLAAKFAKENGIKLTEFLPDWDKHGRAAGFIRNEDIVGAGDFLVAFWDGVSRGTRNDLSIAKRLKKPTLIIYF